MKILHTFIFSILIVLPVFGQNQNNTSNSVYNNKFQKVKALALHSIDSALLFAEELLEVCTNENDSTQIETYFLVAKLYQSKGSFDKAKELLELSSKASSSLSKSKKQTIEGRISLFYGSIEMNKSNYPSALNHFQNSQLLFIETSDSSLLAQAYSKLGLVNYYEYRDSLAMDYYLKALQIHKQQNNQSGISIQTFNIGNLLQESGEYDAAVENYLISLDIEVKLNNKEGQAFSYNNIAQVFILQNKFKDALAFNNQNLEISRELGKVRNILYALHNSAQIKFELNDTEGSKTDITEAKKLAYEVNDTEMISEAYKFLSMLEEDSKNYKEALEYEQLHHLYKDSIFNQTKETEFTEIESKFLANQKQKEIEEQEVLLTEKDEEINHIHEEENFILLMSAIIIIAILCIAGLFFYNLQKKKKLAEELEKLSIVAREIENTVIIADEHGEMEWINESYTRKHGFNLEEFKEKFGKFIVNSNDSLEIHEMVEKCKREKKPVKYVLHMGKKSGEMHWIQTTLTPILDKKGEIRKFVLIDSDVTEVKLAEAKMATQRDELASKNTMITESIDYAKRIQSALFPSLQNLNDCFKDHFIFYKPKDIVSGDFYWQHKNENKTFFAVADCTGHGVPGALISIIGMNELNNIIDNSKTEPKQILEDLSDRIQVKLAHNDHDEQLKDGIDISLCSFEEDHNGDQLGTLQYSGAHNSLYLIRDNQLQEYKGNRIHIGANRRSENIFTQENISIKKGDVIYLFSDGFVDQKGGVKNKKFYYGPFRELLLSINTKSMKDQNEILSDKIDTWRGSSEQLDDMLIWGIRF